VVGFSKIKGLNAGRGSNLQVFKQTVKKAQKEMINNIETETAWKMATVAFFSILPFGKHFNFRYGRLSICR
jgi:hypothetical protein